MNRHTAPSPSPELTALRDELDAYRTCELATLTKSGVPVAWPAVALLDPDAGTFALTTSIALPRKAFNIRRDPRVALLFSDPTGSGRSDRPQVLVRGTATCPDDIHTSPAGLEEYWARLWERQPASRRNSSTALGRRLLDWYYMRLVITVTPETVTSRPHLDAVGPMTAPEPDRGDHSPYAEAARRLTRYASAVLSTVAPGQPPVMRRVRLTADPDNRTLRVDDPTGDPLPAGPAGLVLHGHDDQLWDLRNFGLIGRLQRDSAGWLFVPDRFLAGSDGMSPIGMVKALRDLRRSADRYLKTRHLPRPRVRWEEFERVHG